MWRLSEDATAHALSLALMLSAGRSGRFHGKLPGRSLLLALAVTAGIRAAAGAQQGVGGDPNLLDGPWLRDAQGLDADLAALTARLGEGSVYREMSLKPFCSAKQAIAAVEALIALIRSADKTGIDAPFGWPLEFVHAVAAHSNVEAWPGSDHRVPVGRAQDGPDPRDPRTSDRRGRHDPHRRGDGGRDAAARRCQRGKAARVRVTRAGFLEPGPRTRGPVQAPKPCAMARETSVRS